MRFTLAAIAVGAGLGPVFRWKGHAPDVLRFVQFDATMERVLGMHVGDPRARFFASQEDLDRNFHAELEGSFGQQGGAMQIDNDGLAFTGQVVSATLDADHNLQGDTGTSSGIPNRGVRGTRFHRWVGILLYSGVCWQLQRRRDVVGNGTVEDVDEYEVFSGLDLL